MSDKCAACNGSGYQSAGQNMPADTPSILMPIGCWPCAHCNGTGNRGNPFLTKEDHKKVREAVKKLTTKD